MFKSSLISSLLFLSSNGHIAYSGETAQADLNNKSGLVVVVSSQRNLFATALDDKLFYTKTFDVVVVNTDARPLDLRAGCFKAVMPDKTLHPLDMIEYKLTHAKVRAGDSGRGFSSFSTPDEKIYQASTVKFVPACT